MSDTPHRPHDGVKTDTDTDAASSYEQVRETASRVYHDARDRAADVYDSSKRATKDVAHRAADEIETNPFVMLIGGIAVGALVGALLPRSAKEKELLSPIGRKLGDSARQAFAAAREAGKQELDQAGLTTGAARERGQALFDGVLKAMSSASGAAAQAAKGSTRG
ncbi:DUF883 family protein [Sphingomonas sp. Leaf339]|uniref:DUF883 family protein n=1 Tax=Sphingomonas sp. Leaf339 TaxID=1736343 RepID=UPI0009E66F3D|nr:DUF883 family protein [Sphingomonas sp. Leaf339]